MVTCSSVMCFNSSLDSVKMLLLYYYFIIVVVVLLVVVTLVVVSVGFLWLL